MKFFLVSVFVLILAQLPKCQATVLDPPPSAVSWSNTSAANIASYIPVAASIVYDSYKSYKSVDRKKAFALQGLKTGTNLVASELIKLAVHRIRPDLSDNKSFPSEHTELAAMGSSIAISIPLAAGTGYLRMAANKHFLTDTLTGLGIGFLTGHYIK